jgi:hypothetical protein
MIYSIINGLVNSFIFIGFIFSIEFVFNKYIIEDNVENPLENDIHKSKQVIENENKSEIISNLDTIELKEAALVTLATLNLQEDLKILEMKQYLLDLKDRLDKIKDKFLDMQHLSIS